MSNASGQLQLLLLHPADNVLVSVQSLRAGTEVDAEGVRYQIVEPIAVGHKIARLDMPAGEKIRRYGAPIGSLSRSVKAGEWVHMHNLQSDYLASHTRQSGSGNSSNRSPNGE
ncbi:UxaA family hydrolase [Gilvimarinus japonicus]|jgi:hypothetical protein|uniref:UxaA family hydrolase n=1 Tax=Gilvimarinus japonicus TaxID=1796469 RepID=A0ABV7HMI0_9GAMM